MNGHWNPYSAFNSDGSSRDGDHSTYWFRQAWRRFTLIVRGGRRAKINHRLHRLGLPKIERVKGAAEYEKLGVPATLPKPKVALIWVPQSSGSPNLAANGPEDYWPGGEYVDWVGADTYARFPNFDGLSRLYRSFRHKPFVISEWSPWDTGDPGWVRQLFSWARRHGRTRMLVYYQGWTDGDPHRIHHYTSAKRVLRHQLNAGRFDAFAPYSRRPPDAAPSEGGQPARGPKSRPASSTK
jgi:hypothetical protein